MPLTKRGKLLPDQKNIGEVITDFVSSEAAIRGVLLKRCF